jgi:hypothetical protein
MKKSIIAFCCVLSYVTSQAQTESKTDTSHLQADQIQTLFSNPGRLGWWISPDFAWTQISDKDAFLCGLSGGIIIKNSFSIGLAGYGIVNSQNLKYSGINDTADVYLYGGYGGLKLEYRINPLKMINVAFPLLIGGGGAAYSTWTNDNWHHGNENYNDAYTWDSYFVVEPGVVVGLNLLKFMRFDIGASYRYAPGVQLPRTDSNLMNGFNVNLALQFGRF